MFDDSFQNGFEFATVVILQVFGLDVNDPVKSDKLKRHLQQVVSGEIIPSNFAAPPEVPPGVLAEMFPDLDSNFKESATRVLDWIEMLEQ